MTVTIYGIPNCDTIKKARRWLDDHGVAYDFHDYKRSGVTGDRLAAWIDRCGVDRVLNRAGTTYRKLPDAAKAAIGNGPDDAAAIAVMIDQPSAIKRPIVAFPGGLLVGFDPDAWAAALLG